MVSTEQKGLNLIDSAVRILTVGLFLAAINLGFMNASLKSTWACNETLARSGQLLIAFHILLVGITEAAILGFLAPTIRKFNAPEHVMFRFRFILKLVVIIFATLYLTLMGGSWFFFSNLQVFLGLNHIIGYLNNPVEFLRLLSAGDLLFLILALVVAFSLANFLLLILRRVWTSLGVILLVLIPFVFVLTLRVLPSSFLSLEGNRRYQMCLFHMASPSIYLFWRPLIIEEEPLDRSKVLACRRPSNIEKGAVSKPQNVILLNIEALKHDILDLAQSKTAFPNLSMMKDEGINYRRMFAASSESHYSNVSMLTGQYALRTKHRNIYSEEKYLPFPIHNFFNANKFSTGYFASSTEQWENWQDRTKNSPSLDLLFVSSDLSSSEMKNITSHDDLISMHRNHQLDLALVEKFAKWLPQIPPSKRFFARFFFISSHFPFYPPPPRFRHFAPDELSPSLLRTFSFIKYPLEHAPIMRNRYQNDIAFVDYLIGKLIEAIRASDRTDTTFIVTGDHGEQFGEKGLVNHGTSLYESAVRVPLIFWSHENLAPLVSVESPASHVDIAPSIIKLMGDEQPDVFQGIPLVTTSPVGTDNVRRPIFISLQGFVDKDAVIVWPYKAIRDGLNKSVAVFNLEMDPKEENDLSTIEVERTKCLEDVINIYRASQLTYFSEDSLKQQGCLPPKYDHLAYKCSLDSARMN